MSTSDSGSNNSDNNHDDVRYLERLASRPLGNQVKISTKPTRINYDELSIDFQLSIAEQAFWFNTLLTSKETCSVYDIARDVKAFISNNKRNKNIYSKLQTCNSILSSNLPGNATEKEKMVCLLKSWCFGFVLQEYDGEDYLEDNSTSHLIRFNPSMFALYGQTLDSFTTTMIYNQDTSSIVFRIRNTSYFADGKYIDIPGTANFNITNCKVWVVYDAFSKCVPRIHTTNLADFNKFYEDTVSVSVQSSKRSLHTHKKYDNTINNSFVEKIITENPQNTENTWTTWTDTTTNVEKLGIWVYLYKNIGKGELDKIGEMNRLFWTICIDFIKHPNTNRKIPMLYNITSKIVPDQPNKIQMVWGCDIIPYANLRNEYIVSNNDDRRSQLARAPLDNMLYNEVAIACGADTDATASETNNSTPASSSNNTPAPAPAYDNNDPSGNDTPTSTTVHNIGDTTDKLTINMNNTEKEILSGFGEHVPYSGYKSKNSGIFGCINYFKSKIQGYNTVDFEDKESLLTLKDRGVNYETVKKFNDTIPNLSAENCVKCLNKLENYDLVLEILNCNCENFNVVMIIPTKLINTDTNDDYICKTTSDYDSNKQSYYINFAYVNLNIPNIPSLPYIYSNSISGMKDEKQIFQCLLDNNEENTYEEKTIAAPNDISKILCNYSDTLSNTLSKKYSAETLDKIRILLQTKYHNGITNSNANIFVDSRMYDLYTQLIKAIYNEKQQADFLEKPFKKLTKDIQMGWGVIICAHLNW